MSGRRKAFRLADEMNITTVVAPTREIGLTPGTEKEEAPRAELTDAGQSSRAPGWGQEKGALEFPTMLADCAPLMVATRRCRDRYGRGREVLRVTLFRHSRFGAVVEVLRCGA